MAAVKKRVKYLYVAYTDDKYELPIAVADSATELAKMVGVTSGSMYSMLSRKEGYYCKVKEND